MSPESRLASLLAAYAQACTGNSPPSPVVFCQQQGCPELAEALAVRWQQLRPTRTGPAAKPPDAGFATLPPSTEHDDGSLEILPTEPAQFIPNQPATEAPNRVGRYEMKEVLAHGGMGTVYRAVDTAFGRQVAVKLIHDHFARHPPAIKRFLKEARITAQLQHPGIPPVHDLGSLPDGRVFLVMKLIQGQTLAALIGLEREHATASAAGRTPRFASGPVTSAMASAAERGRQLAIFESICQAVAYAHSKGVLHRDLKPANIMVGAFGEVQVMDWGLAKNLNEPAEEPIGDMPIGPHAQAEAVKTASAATYTSGVTQAGAVLGTPAFMPPEQARGAVHEIDQRSDVFGLGAILCCLLTGDPPHVAPTPELLILGAARGDLTDAYARLDRCGADQAVIELCKRCLSPRKDDRPSDARSVAAAIAEIRTRAEARARQAERASAEAQVREAEQRKRRRLVQVTAGLVALILTAGLAGSLAQMQRAVSAERRALAEAREKDEQRQRAEANERLANEQRVRAQEQEQLARQARDQAEREKAIALTVREFLQTHLLRQANPWEQSGVTDGQALTVRDLIDRAAKEFNPHSIAAKFPNQPLVQAEILETLGETYEGLGEFAKVLPFMKAAYELREKHLGPDHPVTLASLTHLTFAHVACGKQLEAITLINNLLHRAEIALAASLPEARTRIDAILLATERRLNPRRFSLPDMAFGVGEGAFALLQVGQTLPRLQRLATKATQLFGPEDRRTLFVRLLVAFAHHALGQLPTACHIYEELLAMAQARLDPDDWVIDGLREVLAITYGALRIKRREQLHLIAECARSSDRLLGPEHPRTLAAQARLASLLLADGQVKSATSLLEKVLETRLRRFGQLHPETINTQQDLAQAFLNAGRITESLALLESAQTTALKAFGPRHRLTTEAIRQLGLGYLAAGRTAEAVAQLESFQEAMVQKHGSLSPETLRAGLELAAGYRQAGRYADALRLLERIEAARMQRSGAGHAETLLVRSEKALIYQTLGNWAEAKRLWEDIRSRRESALGAEHPDTIFALINLGRVCLLAGQTAMGKELYTEVLNRAGRANYRLLGPSLLVRDVTDVPPLSHRLEEVETWQRTWIEIVREHTGADSAFYASELAFLARLLIFQKKWEQAEKTLEACQAIREQQQPEAWVRFNSLSMLGQVRLARARLLPPGPERARQFAGIEEILLSSFRALQSKHGTIPAEFRNTRLQEAADRLVDFYQEVNQWDQVAKWYAIREALRSGSIDHSAKVR